MCRFFGENNNVGINTDIKTSPDLHPLKNTCGRTYVTVTYE